LRVHPRTVVSLPPSTNSPQKNSPLHVFQNSFCFNPKKKRFPNFVFSHFLPEGNYEGCLDFSPPTSSPSPCSFRLVIRQQTLSYSLRSKIGVFSTRNEKPARDFGVFLSYAFTNHFPSTSARPPPLSIVCVLLCVVFYFPFQNPFQATN